MSFSVVSYNVLAAAHVQRAWYPRTPALVLNSAWRVPALVGYVANLGADIICLQEMEIETFSALRLRLSSLGYASQYAPKRGGRPDGCATFYRRNLFELVDADVVAYGDGDGGEADSGNVALVAVLQSGGRKCVVANTHLTWDPPDIPITARRGDRQAKQLLLESETIADAADARILAGDFNATPDSEIVAKIERAGFRYPHRDHGGVFTCNINGRAKMIDYLFHSSALASEPQSIIRIDDRTILPSAEQPSDHVAIVARFHWVP